MVLVHHGWSNGGLLDEHADYAIDCLKRQERSR
jgi:hypothetical protein